MNNERTNERTICERVCVLVRESIAAGCASCVDCSVVPFDLETTVWLTLIELGGCGCFVSILYSQHYIYTTREWFAWDLVELVLFSAQYLKHG